MNIFEIYLDKIKSIIIDLDKKGDLVIPENLNGINAEIPPLKFDCDVSTNVAMVLSKLNQKSPIILAEQISTIIKMNDPLIKNITVVKPGFINIKFKPLFWSNFIEEIISISKSFGINQKEKKLDKKSCLLDEIPFFTFCNCVFDVNCSLCCVFGCAN